MREHLFISYATEDAALADWLTLKLTSLGYRVWCDRYELLGGERFPKDIDKAIKDKTFRMLALISKASLEKDNPTKERTLALNIGRKREEEFLIPLKVESFDATDLNWMISDITYIPFNRSWAEGLGQLIEKLEKIETPRPLNDGNNIAKNAVFKNVFINEKEEELHSNIISIENLPNVIHRFELKRKPSPPEHDHIEKFWPVYRVDDTTILSFQYPPQELIGKLNIQHAGSASWRDMAHIDRIDTLNIVTRLIKGSLKAICLQKEMREDKERGLIYFPPGLLEGNKIHFINVDKKKTYVLAVGQRTKSGSKYRYHLSPVFYVRRDLFVEFSILLRIRMLITDEEGVPLLPRSAISRRKHLCKNWWNDHWQKRAVAIMSYLSEGVDKISIGLLKEEVAFSSKLMSFKSDFSINEELLESNKTEEEIRYIEAESDIHELNEETDG